MYFCNIDKKNCWICSAFCLTFHLLGYFKVCFRRLYQTVAKNEYELCHACLSVCPKGKNSVVD